MKQFVASILNFISYFDNITQFIVFLATSLVVIFVFTLPYRSPIMAVLKNLGIPTLLTYRIIWLCRKNPRVHIRLYIELSILRSQGIHRDAKWWSNLTSEFINWLDHQVSSGDSTIAVESCFELTTSELANKINHYLIFINKDKPRKFFGIRRDYPVSFISLIHIKEGYLAPITFIAGLQDRYNEDWKKIIAKYMSTFDKKNSGMIIPSELFQSYTWLMWGSSYQINYHDDDYKLIQYGFGDESNSIQVVLRNDAISNDMWKVLNRGNLDTDSQRTFGLYCSLTAKIFDSTTYFRQHRGQFPDQGNAFADRLSRSESGGNFIFEFNENQSLLKHRKHREYFFSTYLWLMFSVNSEKDSSFSPHNTVIFFEHANLAETGNYEFLLSCLMSKCFRHFSEVFSNPSFKERSYTLCLAMNKDIREIFNEELHKYRNNPDNPGLSLAFQTRLIEQTSYSLDEVLDGFDSYFTNEESHFTYLDVRIDNPKSIQLLCEFYAYIYLNEFPDSNERESLDNIMMYLSKKQSHWYGNNNYHVTIMLDSEQHVVGGAICDYIHKTNCGVIEFMAIHEDCRRKGYGAALYNHVLTKLRSNARGTRQDSLAFVLAEVNNPMYNHLTRDDSEVGRIHFWNKLGFRILDFPYIQPSLSPEKEPVRSLVLTCRTYDERLQEPEIASAVLVNALEEYARLAMRIEDPASNPEVKEMTDYIRSQNVVTTSSLLNLVQ